MRKLLAPVMILGAGSMTSGSVLAQNSSGDGSAFTPPVSIRLFEATETFSTGRTIGAPTEATLFGSTMVILDIQPGDTFVISSTPDGTGPIVVDDFLTINRVVNACTDVPGRLFPEDVSCSGESIQDSPDPNVIGQPIDAVLTPIPPIDVTPILSALPRGRNEVVFELRDFGTTAGNTDLFLVIAGANGGSPAGGIGPAIPTGPELELRTGCLNGEFGAVVQNVGDEPSEPTSVTGILERVTVTEVVEETPGDPVVMPGDPVVTPGDPVVMPGDPVVTPADPVVTPADPVVTPADPVVTPGDPVITPTNGSEVLVEIQADIPILDPGSEPELINIPTDGCPLAPVETDRCVLDVAVDAVPTSDECRAQNTLGIVCEADESNNSAKEEVAPGACLP